MKDDACAGDCGGVEWRYCPHCGRPLPTQSVPERRPPTMAEFASLRAKGMTYKEIAHLFGYAAADTPRRVEAHGMAQWQRESVERLARSYRESGGPLRRPERPGSPWSWNDAVAVHTYREASRAYDEAHSQWLEAIGATALRAAWQLGSVRYWQAAVAGRLPGPIPRWPEAE